MELLRTHSIQQLPLATAQNQILVEQHYCRHQKGPRTDAFKVSNGRICKSFRRTIRHLHHGRLCKVPLQTELELREEAQEGERGVEVDVICVPHDVLNALQVQELANAVVGVDKGLRLWYGQYRFNT
jgi:hypothetical protein